MIKRLLLSIIFLNVCLYSYSQTATYLNGFSIAGPNNDNGNFIGMDSLENIYVAGIFGSACDFDPGSLTSTLTSSGSSDIYIAKYSPAGTLIWKYPISAPTESLFGLEVDKAGNAYVFGSFSTNMTAFGQGSNLFVTSVGNSDAFLVVYNPNGQLKFMHNIGSANPDAIRSVVVDNNGNYYLSGDFRSSQLDIDPGPNQVILANTTTIGTEANPYIAKFDSSGNYIWALNLRGTVYGRITSLDLDDNGRLLAGGYLEGSMMVDSANTTISNIAAGINSIILRFSSAGIYDAGWSFGGPNSDYLVGLVTTGNDIVATGYFIGTMDIDPTAGTDMIIAQGSTEIYITKINENGVYQWGGNIKGALQDLPTAIEANNAGDIYITGSMRDSAYFDLFTNSSLRKSFSARDGFIAKYSAAGNLITAFNVGGFGSDGTESIAHNGSDKFVVTGTASDDVYLSPVQFSLLNNAGNQDAFIGRYSDSLITTGISIVTLNDIKLYPVPANDFINIELKSPGNYTSQVMDMSGRIVIDNATIFYRTAQIDIHSLESGCYFVVIKNNGIDTFCNRFIKR